MIKNNSNVENIVTIFPDSHGGKHDLMWKRLERYFADARVIDFDNHYNEREDK